MVKNNKLYDAINEINEKGTFQDQAFNLCREEKIYKKLIVEYLKQIADTDGINVPCIRKDLELMISKYEIRLNNVKNEMCYLNKRIIDSLEVIERYVDVEVFCELFGLDYNNYEFNESFYDNLLTSSNVVGHVCRQGLIHNEKIVKDYMEEC
jgi:thymidine kinase